MKPTDAQVVQWQAQVKPGDCFMSDWGEGFPVYGEEHLQHCRFCRCFSAVCPEGELGDVHVSTIRCIVSRGLFERLNEQGCLF